MPTVVNEFDFFIQENPSCWTGASSFFELKMMRALPDYALEQLRQRVFYAVTTDHARIRSARAILQMGFETELNATLNKIVRPAPDVLAARVCERRRYLDIDRDLQQYRFLIGPALEAMIQAVPAPYARLLRRYIGSDYARYRVSGVCALLCFATAHFIPDVTSAITRAATDTVTVADAATHVLVAGPPPEFVAASSAYSGTFGNTVVVSKPAGTQAGDVMLAIINSGNNVALSSAPSGWLHMADSPVIDGSNALRVCFMYKVAGAGEPSSYSWIKGGVDIFGVMGGIITVRNVHNAFPISAAVSAATNGTVAYPHVLPDLVTPADNCMLVGFHGVRGSMSIGINPWTTGFTEALELLETGVTHIQGVYRLQDTAGLVTGVNVPLTGGSGSSTHISALIALTWAA